MTQDFTKRFTIVVRNDIEPWQAMNAVAHIAAKLGRDVERFDTGDSFAFAGGSMPRNSQYPIIVFQAASSDDLRALLAEIRASQLPYLAFVREMLDLSDDAELAKILSGKAEADIEYLGVGCFGDNANVKKLAKHFSLWK